MPSSSGRRIKVILTDDSSSAAESSCQDDEDVAPKRGATKRQTHLTGGVSNVGLGSSPRSAVVIDAGSSDDDLPIPTPRAVQHRAVKRSKPSAVPDDSDDDSDDVPLTTPKASRGRALAKREKRPAPADDSDDDEDLPSTNAISFNSHLAKVTKRTLEDSDDDDVVVPSTKRRRLARRASSPAHELSSDQDNGRPTQSSPIKRHKSNPHTEKMKKRELLRRRRAGENVTFDDLESSEGSDRRGLYDTDSDHQALEEFDDDEEGVLEPQPRPNSKTKFGKKKDIPEKDRSADGNDDDEAAEEMKDFIDEDEDGVLGVPGELLDIPIEFTAHARASLKVHFRHVVEWLVHFKFEHNFDQKHNELYLLAWKRLDDEVAGLASSKFASSVWKQEFHRALNARPKFSAMELPRGDLDRLMGTCEACGRSGHPATWTVSFDGAAYYRKSNRHAHFLEDVESDEEDDDEDSSSDDPSGAADSDDGDEEESADRAKATTRSSARREQRDEDGLVLPPEGKQWSVGSVCKSNAETAHTLIHWKHNLLEWVGDRLENDGHMTPARIAARTRMKRKQKTKAVEGVIDGWDGQRVIEGLYRDFRGVLDEARNKSTTGRGGGRWGR